MGQQGVIDIAAEAIVVAMKIGAPALIAIMLTGLVVSIFQAATQINEQTLSFIPKILAMTAAIVVGGPWILTVLMSFTKSMFTAVIKVTH